MESYIDGSIEVEGWSEWNGDQGLDTLRPNRALRSALLGPVIT